MKYMDGKTVTLGDRVKLGNDPTGVVVADIDGDKYSPDNPKEKWGFLESGVVIHFDSYGLIHYFEPEEDLRLISRSQ